MKKYKIAVVGSTGAVGREMIRYLIKKNFPFESIKALASKDSAGSTIEIDGHSFVVEELGEDSFQSIDIALFAAGGSISAKFAPKAVQSNAIVIDNSSFFRMDPNVPLIIPEVNGEELLHHQGIIANPNCSTIQMVAALKPIDDRYGINKIIVSTYQAVSGAGNKAGKELFQQMEQLANQEKVEALVLPVSSLPIHHQIINNVIPQIDAFNLETLYTKEEHKMIDETNKILKRTIEIVPTCVRVPVYRGHSESVYVETKEKVDLKEVQQMLSHQKLIRIIDDLENQKYPMPIHSAFKEEIFVGRIRKSLFNDCALNLWIVSDNLLKGAATNAIDIAFKILELKLK